METRPAGRDSKKVYILTSKYGFEAVFSTQGKADSYKAHMMRKLAAYRMGANLQVEVETLDPEVNW